MANEKRLIDADALVDTVEGVNWYHINKLGYLANGANSQDHTPIYKAEDIYNAIRNAPTVDAVEVVHGRWVNGGLFSDIAKCSVCGAKLFTMEFVCANKFSYCPNCGAKMDGGNEDG